MHASAGDQPPLVVGRYSLHGKLASGGMASVHLGRVEGAAGFVRTVAIKRLHPHFAEDPEFASMFVNEARLAARIKHPNVVPTVDVVQEGGELFLVMEYIEGEALSTLMRLAKGVVPIDVGVGILVGALRGLHAAHTAKNEQGEPLGLVHRDVSPQNVMVGTDGAPRVLDFGVAKAIGYGNTTRSGQLKGKVAYFAPEQIEGKAPTRQVDIFAAGVLLWEVLAGRRLFAADNEAATLARIMALEVPPISTVREGVPRALDAVLAKALARAPADRFASAEEMADAIEAASPPASPRAIGRWVQDVAGSRISERAAGVAEIERSGTGPTTIGPAVPTEPSSAAVVVAPRKLVAIGAAGLGGIALVAVIAVFALHARSRESSSPVPSVSFAAPPAVSSVATAAEVPAPPPIASSAPIASPVTSTIPRAVAPVHTSPRAVAAATKTAAVQTSAPASAQPAKPAATAQADAGKPSLYGRD